jgi:muramidase (phage lysozyme)
MGNRNPTKHYSQETKEWAIGTLQNTTKETKEWATGTLLNTIHRKLKNGQQEPYKTLYTGNTLLEYMSSHPWFLLAFLEH